MEGPSIPDFPSVTSPVPSYRSTVSENEQAPIWAREVAASLQNRQRVSRASSIVSTRTKISTNTAHEDARSIDLTFDGVCFRINRDGSRITTSGPRDSLPPYVPNHEAQDVDGGYSQVGRGEDGVRDDESVSTEVGHPTPEPNPSLLSPVSHRQGNPAEHLLASPTSHLRATADISLARNPSFTPGKEELSVTKKRTVSQNDVHSYAAIRRKPLAANTRLHRRNGVRLPTLNTNLTDGQQPQSVRSQNSAPDSASPAGKHARSADPTLGNDNHSFRQRPRSPMFIGRHAPGLFPSPPMESSWPRPPAYMGDPVTVTAHNPARLEGGSAGAYPPPMESENDISVHYTRMIRLIDREHRKALHERDKEMASLRERLNEQDTIYRQQLRARDFIIDDLKSRLAHLETSTEATVEKACNSIEDMWESRWKDRDFHLTERMRRMETDLVVAVERTIAERDKVWSKGWATKYKQLIQRLQDAGQVTQDDIEKYDASPPIL